MLQLKPEFPIFNINFKRIRNCVKDGGSCLSSFLYQKRDKKSEYREPDICFYKWNVQKKVDMCINYVVNH
jgi:Uma2 family endonuclease